MKVSINLAVIFQKMAQFELTVNKKLALSHREPKTTEPLSWKCWAAGAQDLESTATLRPGASWVGDCIGNWVNSTKFGLQTRLY